VISIQSKLSVLRHIASIGQEARLKMAQDRWDAISLGALYRAAGAMSDDEKAEVRRVAEILAATHPDDQIPYR
jgi:hypothetical protein